jgi:hypothetical protein
VIVKLAGRFAAQKQLRISDLAARVILVSRASARVTAVHYIEYRQILRKVQPLQSSGIAGGATLDVQLWVRAESQTPGQI